MGTREELLRIYNGSLEERRRWFGIVQSRAKSLARVERKAREARERYEAATERARMAGAVLKEIEPEIELEEMADLTTAL